MIDNEVTELEDIKLLLKDALASIGIEVSEDDTLVNYVEKVRTLPSQFDTQYKAYLDDICITLNNLGITPPAKYSDLDTTIASSYNAILDELQEISSGNPT